MGLYRELRSNKFISRRYELNTIFWNRPYNVRDRTQDSPFIFKLTENGRFWDFSSNPDHVIDTIPKLTHFMAAHGLHIKLSVNSKSPFQTFWGRLVKNELYCIIKNYITRWFWACSRILRISRKIQTP